jgi:hypothetical protein
MGSINETRLDPEISKQKYTDGQQTLSGTEVRDLFAMKHYGPKSITGFNAEELCGHVLTVTAKGNVTSKSQKRRTFSALLRSVMGKAQS